MVQRRSQSYSIDGAREALGNVRAWLDAVPVIVFPLHSNWAMAAMCLGELAEVDAAMDSLAEMVGGRHEFPQAAHTLALHRAMAARLRGRPSQAARLLRDGDLDAHSGVAAVCLVECAHALALSGDAPGARQALARARTSGTVFRKMKRMWLGTAEPWVSAASGELTRAVERAAEAAASAR